MYKLEIHIGTVLASDGCISTPILIRKQEVELHLSCKALVGGFESDCPIFLFSCAVRNIGIRCIRIVRPESHHSICRIFEAESGSPAVPSS